MDEKPLEGEEFGNSPKKVPHDYCVKTLEHHYHAVQAARKEFEEKGCVTKNLDCLTMFKEPDDFGICQGIHYVCNWGSGDDSEEFATIKAMYEKAMRGGVMKNKDKIVICELETLVRVNVCMINGPQSARIAQIAQIANAYKRDLLHGFIMPPIHCPLYRWITDKTPLTPQGERRRNGYVESDGSYARPCMPPKLIDIKGWLRNWLFK